MVRHGVPIYVANPQSNPRVHTQLVNYTDTEAYVAAPIFAWGAPIGLLHADRPAELGLVSEFDRGLLAAFAEGLGLAFERNVLLERLRAMQNAANDYLQDVNALADDFRPKWLSSLAWQASTSGRRPRVRPNGVTTTTRWRS